MSGGQSYIVRLLRKVEVRLNEHGYAVEASRVGKIVQKLAQAEDIHESLNTLYGVDGFSDFALRLMWLQEVAERGTVGLENGAMDYQCSALAGILVGEKPPMREDVHEVPEQVDQLYDALHKLGREIDTLKRDAGDAGISRRIAEDQIYSLLNELASLREHAATAGKKDIVQFALACTEFVQYALDNNLFHDVRVVNILDNANLTLQTVFDAAGVDDNDALQSTIELLKQAKDLLD
jgi:hypothetical protein